MSLLWCEIQTKTHFSCRNDISYWKYTICMYSEFSLMHYCLIHQTFFIRYNFPVPILPPVSNVYPVNLQNSLIHHIIENKWWQIDKYSPYVHLYCVSTMNTQCVPCESTMNTQCTQCEPTMNTQCVLSRPTINTQCILYTVEPH